MNFARGILFSCIFALTVGTVWAVDFPTAQTNPTINSANFPGNNSTEKNTKLSAQQFPKTVSDLTFIERNENLTVGYSMWGPEFDTHGKCIKNCPYAGITIEDDRANLERNTRIAQAILAKLQAEAAANDQLISEQRYWFSSDELKHMLPTGVPLLGKLSVASRFNDVRTIEGEINVHRGIDFSCAVGTPVFATGDGVVERVFSDKISGNAVRIKHINGFISGYAHLSKILVKDKDKITAGQMIGLSGNTGRSTGPHLHYCISNSNIISSANDGDKWIDPELIHGKF